MAFSWLEWSQITHLITLPLIFFTICGACTMKSKQTLRVFISNNYLEKKFNYTRYGHLFMTNDIFEPHKSNKPCLFEHKKKELDLEQFNQQIQPEFNLTSKPSVNNMNNIERLTSFDSYTNRTIQSRNINPNKIIWNRIL